MVRVALLLVLGLIIAVAPDPPRVLVFSKTAGFRHASIPDGMKCIKEILGSDFAVDATEDATRFTKENLGRYRVVVFLSTTGDVLDAAQQSAFQEYIESGGGFVGVHAATDTEHGWPWYEEMIGAHFAGHPDIQKATVIVEDRTHASTAMLPDRWDRTDEWYRFNRNPRKVDGIHVLARMDETTYQGGGMPDDHPCMWWREMKSGRSWYTAGGHTKESFSEPLFKEHLRQGIIWASNVAVPAVGKK